MRKWQATAPPLGIVGHRSVQRCYGPIHYREDEGNISLFIVQDTSMLKVAVIGAGWVAGARHIPALRRSGRCQIVGVIDHRLDRAQALAARYRLANAADKLDAPWLETVDACSVAVAPRSHFDVCRELLERGKHVLLEKPMCLTVAEGETLVQLAESRQRVLALVHNFQFARSVVRARKMLEQGKWGRIIGLHGLQLSSPDRRLPTWFEQLPLGLFYDESPHLLYLLRAFGGPMQIRRASQIPSAHGHVTPAVLQVELDAGSLPATLFMNFEAPISEWQLMVLTERGAAVIDIFRDILVFIPHDGRHEAHNVLRSSWAMLWGHAIGCMRSGLRMLTGRLLYGNEEVVRRFLDAVEGKAPLRDIDARTGLEILRLQHAILEKVQA
jgi:scyllo-inositol 2-dehydrogenase (NADP+)